jgi:hypothetical protein
VEGWGFCAFPATLCNRKSACVKKKFRKEDYRACRLPEIDGIRGRSQGPADCLFYHFAQAINSGRHFETEFRIDAGPCEVFVCGFQESSSAPVMHAKLFTPDARWTWIITEGSEEDGDWLLFGFAIGLEEEWGYFLLSEMASVQGPLGLAVERDLWFQQGPIDEVLRRESCRKCNR